MQVDPITERRKELFWVMVAVSLPALVFGNAFYQVYFTTIEYNVEFKVFEANFWDVNNKAETQILTWGVGKFYFLGNWTGQFIEGHTYNVTYVQKDGYANHICNNLIVVEWREIG